MEINDEHKKILKVIDPLVRKLTAKVSEYTDMCFTGFIYKSSDPPMLLQVGNITDTGANLVRVHWILSHMAAHMQATGEWAPASQYNESQPDSGPKPPDPVSVADKLALALLSVPEENLPGHVLELLDQYAESRKPEKE